MRKNPHFLVPRPIQLGALVLVGGLIGVASTPASAGFFDKLKDATKAAKSAGDLVKSDKDDSDGNCSSVGGLLGGVIGHGNASAVQSGCLVAGDLADLLGEDDQEELAKSTEQAIATGETATFEGQDSGVQGTVQVTETTTTQEQGSVTVLKDRVEQMPPLELIGAEYVAISKLNVRGGPGTEYKVVESLDKDKTVQVIGKVVGQEWFLIGQGGVATGFVYQTLVSPTGQIGGNQAPPEGEVAQVQVDTAVTCRTMEQQITLDDGSVHTEQIEACQKPDGTWEMT